jgi:hypothetical protein
VLQFGAAKLPTGRLARTLAPPKLQTVPLPVPLPNFEPPFRGFLKAVSCLALEAAVPAVWLEWLEAEIAILAAQLPDYLVHAPGRSVATAFPEVLPAAELAPGFLEGEGVSQALFAAALVLAAAGAFSSVVRDKLAAADCRSVAALAAVELEQPEFAFVRVVSVYPGGVAVEPAIAAVQWPVAEVLKVAERLAVDLCRSAVGLEAERAMKAFAFVQAGALRPADVVVEPAFALERRAAVQLLVAEVLKVAVRKLAAGLCRSRHLAGVDSRLVAADCAGRSRARESLRQLPELAGEPTASR